MKANGLNRNNEKMCGASRKMRTEICGECSKIFPWPILSKPPFSAAESVVTCGGVAGVPGTARKVSQNISGLSESIMDKSPRIPHIS